MIKFQGVTKAFGRARVLDNLDLHIEKGKITFIVGKSGEGKSVTIKHIMGLMRPDSGSIIVDGQDVSVLTPIELRAHRRKFGMLFQHAALFDSMTVAENVLFPLTEGLEQNKKDPKYMQERLAEVLVQVGLPAVEDKFPSELSTGEKKRIGLARALVARPRILLFDEPTTGMDPIVSEMIDELIVKVSKDEQEMTSVVISHDLKAALATAEKIIMLYKGCVTLSGTPKEFERTENPIVRQFFSGKVEGPMELI